MDGSGSSRRCASSFGNLTSGRPPWFLLDRKKEFAQEAEDPTWNVYSMIVYLMIHMLEVTEEAGHDHYCSSLSHVFQSAFPSKWKHIIYRAYLTIPRFLAMASVAGALRPNVVHDTNHPYYSPVSYRTPLAVWISRKIRTMPLNGNGMLFESIIRVVWADFVRFVF